MKYILNHNLGVTLNTSPWLIMRNEVIKVTKVVENTVHAIYENWQCKFPIQFPRQELKYMEKIPNRIKED